MLTSGSAKRRRERQLRAFHRHEVLSVKLALATALHHSAQRVEVPREMEEYATYVGPRAQKTPLRGCGQTVCSTCLDRRNGCSGAPWSRLSTTCRWSRFSMLLLEDAEDRRPLRGDPSAQDLKPFLSSSSSSSSCAADGGTAGACATAGHWTGAGMCPRCQ